jgi:hypothetical protein
MAMKSTISVGTRTLPARVCHVCPGNAKILLADWERHQERHRWRALFEKWTLTQTAPLPELHQLASDSTVVSFM